MITSGSPSTVPLRVAVLSGGDSDEREISLQSGAAVSQALTKCGHRVHSIDPLSVDLVSHRWSDVDAVFLALHGRFGEDGQAQGILEETGVPFTGSGRVASRLAFSKSASKERFLQERVPTPAYVLIHQSNNAAQIARQARTLGYPLVVKPDSQGSSLGVSIVNCAEDLPQALSKCFHFDCFGILEAAVIGTEWTVGLLDDWALPVIQVETDRPFYDYQAKYEDETTRYRFDTRTPLPIVQRIEETARMAHQALQTQGLVRVDLRLDRHHRPWVLEVNTIPGFTQHSLVPKAAMRAGIGLGELCEMALRSCLGIAAERAA